MYYQRVFLPPTLYQRTISTGWLSGVLIIAVSLTVKS
jgi:hypothetical protein